VLLDKISFTNMDQGTDIALPRWPTVERIYPMTVHARFNEDNGMAALGICETLLIALTELGVEL
jgi:hypothetical protein